MIDPLSDTWLTVEGVIKARIEAQRQGLESQRDPIIAAEHRGQILALKNILGLVSSTIRPEMPATQRAYAGDPSGY